MLCCCVCVLFGMRVLCVAWSWCLRVLGVVVCVVGVCVCIVLLLFVSCLVLVCIDLCGVVYVWFVFRWAVLC